MAQYYPGSSVIGRVNTAQLHLALKVVGEELTNALISDTRNKLMTGILINSHPGTGKSRMGGLIIQLHYALNHACLQGMSLIPPIYKAVIVACPNKDICDNFRNELDILFGTSTTNLDYIYYMTYSSLIAFMTTNNMNDVLLILDEVHELITSDNQIQYTSLADLQFFNNQTRAETGSPAFKRIIALTATPITNNMAQLAPLLSLLTVGIQTISTDALTVNNDTPIETIKEVVRRQLIPQLAHYFKKPFVIHFPADFRVIRYVEGQYTFADLVNPNNLIFNGQRSEGYGIIYSTDPTRLNTAIELSPAQELIYRSWLLTREAAKSYPSLESGQARPFPHFFTGDNLAATDTPPLYISMSCQFVGSFQDVANLLARRDGKLFIYDVEGSTYSAANLILTPTTREFYQKLPSSNPAEPIDWKELISTAFNVNYYSDLSTVSNMEHLRRVAMIETYISTKLALLGRLILGVPGKKLVHMWIVDRTRESSLFKAFLEGWALLRYAKRRHVESKANNMTAGLLLTHSGEPMNFPEGSLNYGMRQLSMADLPHYSEAALANDYYYVFAQTASDLHRLSALPHSAQVTVFISDSLGASQSLHRAELSIQMSKRWTGSAIKQISFRTIRGSLEGESPERYIMVMESRRTTLEGDDAAIARLVQLGRVSTIDQIRDSVAAAKDSVTDELTRTLLDSAFNLTSNVMPRIDSSIINPTMEPIPEGSRYRELLNPHHYKLETDPSLSDDNKELYTQQMIRILANMEVTVQPSDATMPYTIRAAAALKRKIEEL